MTKKKQMGMMTKKTENAATAQMSNGPTPLFIVSVIVISLILLSAISAFISVKIHPEGIGYRCVEKDPSPDPRCTPRNVSNSAENRAYDLSYINDAASNVSDASRFEEQAD